MVRRVVFSNSRIRVLASFRKHRAQSKVMRCAVFPKCRICVLVIVVVVDDGEVVWVVCIRFGVSFATILVSGVRR